MSHLKLFPRASPIASPRAGWLLSTLLVGLALLRWPAVGGAADLPLAPWWPEADLEPALRQAGTNRQELLRVLDEAPVQQREGAAFLLTNMPPRDLQSLSAAFLLEQLALAYQTRRQATWASQIPTDLFLNDVLPYASVDEPRDNWRQRLAEISAPLVQDCKTASEAAQRLNQRLFGQLKVRYSMTRRRPAQGPFETMTSGVATCTGLSILLVDACRSVGVPARIVGTRWAQTRGNHTWVEIWDGGWHFMGAAEPDPNGLDRGWFVGNASQAPRDDPRYAIYASSFKQTGLTFPLAWAPWVRYVSGVDVTGRYAPQGKPADLTNMRLLVRVLDRPGGQRVAAQVSVTDGTNSAARYEGTSKDDSADMNDDVVFTLPKGRSYFVEASLAGQTRRQEFTPGTNGQQLLTIPLTGPTPMRPPDGKPAQ